MDAFEYVDYLVGLTYAGERNMTKRPTRTTRRTRGTAKVQPFVVYVNFPSSSKEYAYLCDIPEVKQGSIVIANGAEVIVRRTAEADGQATKWVTSRSTFDQLRRKQTIMDQLRQIEKIEAEMVRFKKLKSPEARRLLKELESL